MKNIKIENIEGCFKDFEEIIEEVEIKAQEIIESEKNNKKITTKGDERLINCVSDVIRLKKGLLIYRNHLSEKINRILNGRDSNERHEILKEFKDLIEEIENIYNNHHIQ